MRFLHFQITYNGTSCLDRLINQDRLQIVKMMYENTENLWSSAKCYGIVKNHGYTSNWCFIFFLDCYLFENNTQTHNLSKATKKFEEYYQNYNNCITSTTDDDLCSKCLKDYNILHNYFTSISDTNERISYCMDVVDIVSFLLTLKYILNCGFSSFLDEWYLECLEFKLL